MAPIRPGKLRVRGLYPQGSQGHLAVSLTCGFAVAVNRARALMAHATGLGVHVGLNPRPCTREAMLARWPSAAASLWGTARSDMAQPRGSSRPSGAKSAKHSQTPLPTPFGGCRPGRSFTGSSAGAGGPSGAVRAAGPAQPGGSASLIGFDFGP